MIIDLVNGVAGLDELKMWVFQAVEKISQSISNEILSNEFRNF